MRLPTGGFAAALALLVLAGCSGDTENGPPDADSTPEDSPTAIECDYMDADEETIEVVEAETPPTEPDWEGTVEATLQTSAGDIGMTLDADGAPCSVNAILSLADQGFYDDTTCHQLSTGEMSFLQCGDPTGTGSGSPPWVFADEVDGDETYEAGTIAMANGGADTNGSQFFIVYEDTPFNPEYTVLGTVDEAGLDLLRSIAASGTTTGLAEGPPLQTVTITAFEPA